MAYFRDRLGWIIAAAILVSSILIATVILLHRRQPRNPKTVYVLPKPNPERPKILERALQPPKSAYSPAVGTDNPQPETHTDTNLDTTSPLPSEEKADLTDEELARMLPAIDATDDHESGFPPVPDGFLDDNPQPIWLTLPGYKKGDQPEIENIARVLIKLWNQGERGFRGGIFAPMHNKVYPVYPDVQYVEWRRETIHHTDGTTQDVMMIVSSVGATDCLFEPTDFLNDRWQDKYPDLSFVDYANAGYNPDTFLTDND